MHVVPDLRTGGAERHVTTLFSHLDPTEFSPCVVCVGGTGELFGDLTAAGVPAVALHRTKRQAIRALFDLVGEMRRRRPDVVLVRGYNAEVLGRLAAILAGVPRRVVWVHHCGDTEPRGTLRQVVDRLLDPFTDAYFGVAQAQKNYLVNQLGYPERKIRIIHNGVDPRLFLTVEPSKSLVVSPHSGAAQPGPGGLPPGSKVRTELGIAPHAPVVGILAALRPEKDHVTLLRAARKMIDDVPELVILIVGDGPARNEILQEADKLGLASRLVLTGSRSDVSEVLLAMTVFTLSSRTVECFPIALLEAMAAGRPAVCTEVGGLAEIIEDSVTGFLVPPNDPDALAERLTVLLRDPSLRERMGAAARAAVEEGMKSLKDDAMEKILLGTTTLEESLRVIYSG
jgi:glycosyltransferase involved in cell wall biosynthesis